MLARDTIAKAMGVMTERRTRHLAVTEDDKLAGLISIGDVVKQRLIDTIWKSKRYAAMFHSGPTSDIGKTHGTRREWWERTGTLIRRYLVSVQRWT